MDQSAAWIALISLIVTGLGAVAFMMIKRWGDDWETRLVAQDERLDRHSERLNRHGRRLNETAVVIARIESDLEHIKERSDETHDDVKELLKLANGH